MSSEMKSIPELRFPKCIKDGEWNFNYPEFGVIEKDAGTNGLLTGGYGEDELIKAGAYRIFKDPSDLLKSLDELGLTH